MSDRRKTDGPRQHRLGMGRGKLTEGERERKRLLFTSELALDVDVVVGVVVVVAQFLFLISERGETAECHGPRQIKRRLGLSVFAPVAPVLSSE